jgi:chaperone modulatory protein CbpM
MDPTARADRSSKARPATYALVRPARLDLESFARATGTHPELVTRLVVLGLLDAEPDAGGRLCFASAETATMARIQRLRAGFALNYAALGLVLDLLDRLEAAEASLRHVSPRSGGRPWTPPI